MSELLSQLMTPSMTVAVIVFAALLVLVYVLAIVWVARDAYQRGAKWKKWALITIIPIFGVVAYLLCRPPLYQIDKEEQELEVALKQRELMKYGECAKCGYPVEADFVLCPNCHQRLKNLCPVCHHALDATWSVCPYCTTPIPNAQPQRRMPAQNNARMMGMGANGPGMGAPMGGRTPMRSSNERPVARTNEDRGSSRNSRGGSERGKSARR